MTEKNLTKLQRQQAAFVATWQANLGLLDWHITCNINATQEDLDLGTFGQCSIMASSKRATITVLSPERFYGPYTWENTVVHELMEILFSDLMLLADLDVPGTREKERIIETLTRALVGGY